MPSLTNGTNDRKHLERIILKEFGVRISEIKGKQYLVGHIKHCFCFICYYCEKYLSYSHKKISEIYDKKARAPISKDIYFIRDIDLDDSNISYRVYLKSKKQKLDNIFDNYFNTQK